MAVFYTQNEERANFITHAFGAAAGIAVGIWFLGIVYARFDALAQLGMWLYVFGLLSSYGASAAYHGCNPGTRLKSRLRKFDHIAIYWHIAGSYSPVCLIGMRSDMFWGWILFAVVWICALAGSLANIRKLEDHSHLETVCFVAMGLAVLIAFKPVLDAVGWHVMGWIIAEGVMFIVGALFYSMIKIRYLHTVFHIFVLLGSACHVIALWYMLM